MNKLAAKLDETLAFRFPCRPPYRCARTPGYGERLPGRGPNVRLRRLDNDLVAVAQVRIDRNMAAVDIGGDRLVTDVGMNRIREVQRGRSPSAER